MAYIIKAQQSNVLGSNESLACVSWPAHTHRPSPLTDCVYMCETSELNSENWIWAWGWILNWTSQVEAVPVLLHRTRRWDVLLSFNWSHEEPLPAAGRLDGVWLPARLPGPIHYQVWWCHSGTTCADQCTHTHTLHIHTLWHSDAHEEREALSHSDGSAPHRNMTERRFLLHSCSLGGARWIFTYAFKIWNAHVSRAHPTCTTQHFLCTQTLTQLMKSRIPGSVWPQFDLPLRSMSADWSRAEAHISTQ